MALITKYVREGKLYSRDSLKKIFLNLNIMKILLQNLYTFLKNIEFLRLLKGKRIFKRKMKRCLMNQMMIM